MTVDAYVKLRNDSQAALLRVPDGLTWQEADKITRKLYSLVIWRPANAERKNRKAKTS